MLPTCEQNKVPSPATNGHQNMHHCHRTPIGDKHIKVTKSDVISAFNKIFLDFCLLLAGKCGSLLYKAILNKYNASNPINDLWRERTAV